MSVWIKAGSRYFAAIFVLGFALGTLRTLWLLPRVGELAAVALELPLMLAASWWLSKRLTARYKVPACTRARLAMGALAFSLLMAAELFLSLVVFGMGWQAQLAHYATAAGVLGLAGQVLFALIPWLQKGAIKG